MRSSDHLQKLVKGGCVHNTIKLDPLPKVEQLFQKEQEKKLSLLMVNDVLEAQKNRSD